MGAADSLAARGRGERPPVITRRDLVRDAFAAGIFLGFSRHLSALGTNDPWSALPDILGRIVPPKFPARDFVITKFGAKLGSDASDAISKAIDACARAGGGRVVIPSGEFFTGPIHLKSRVNLRVDGVLKFTQDVSRYPSVLTRWEGVELMNYSPLIYALDCEDIAITGDGTLEDRRTNSIGGHGKASRPASAMTSRRT